MKGNNFLVLGIINLFNTVSSLFYGKRQQYKQNQNKTKQKHKKTKQKQMDENKLKLNVRIRHFITTLRNCK